MEVRTFFGLSPRATVWFIAQLHLLFAAAFATTAALGGLLAFTLHGLFAPSMYVYALRELNCEECRYCHGWAAKAVRIDERWRAECLALYRSVFEEMESGKLWRLRKHSWPRGVEPPTPLRRATEVPM